MYANIYFVGTQFPCPSCGCGLNYGWVDNGHPSTYIDIGTEVNCKSYALQWFIPNTTIPKSDIYTVNKYGDNAGFYFVNCAGIVSGTLPGIQDNNNRAPCISKTGDPCDCPPGMPVWHVSEPYIQLWIEDEPLGYQPALGPRVSFHLAFKQQEIDTGYDPLTFSIGKKWNFSWFSFVDVDAYKNPVVHFPSGGSSTLTNGIDFLTHAQITGATNTGFTVWYPDGTTNIFNFRVTNSAGVFTKAYLTEQDNAAGQRLLFSYANYDNTAPVIRLQSITDGDGLVTSLSYVSANAYSTNLISTVTDPFGRTATLLYDSAGHLTNITDVMGLSSSLTYGNFDWVSTLITPYGTNTFNISDSVGTNMIPNGRFIQITEPDGGKQLYLFTNNVPGLSNSYASPLIPNLWPFTGTTIDNSSLATNNSFYWGRLQYAGLSSGFTSTGDIAQLTANDYVRGRMRHWLRFGPGTQCVSEVISLERLPSSDGTTAGQITWFDYAGKTNSEYTGTERLPLFVARVLPDGTTQFTRSVRNTVGLPLSEISTYTVGASVALRTNLFLYAANSIDILSATNALGIRTISNTFNAAHQVLTNLNALSETTVYTYNASHQLTSVTRPNGLITTNIYFTSGVSSNYLDRTIDYDVSKTYRSNLYTWASGLIYTHTDPRGLTTTHSWDALQRLNQLAFPDGTFVEMDYGNLDLIRIVDRMGFAKTFDFNSLRQLVAVTDQNGVVTRYGYCSCGSVTAVTNAFGSSIQTVTSFSYDNQGNLVQALGPDNYLVSYGYNSLGQMTNQSDGRTSITNLYNNQGLLAVSSNAFGQVLSRTYDALDRVTTNVDANGISISSTFDALDRVLTRTYPDSGVERFGYTANIAALTAYTNQLGSNVVNYTYDGLSRKTAETVPTVFTNNFAYGPGSDLLTLTDGKNQVTTWNFDTFGRVTNKLDATSTEVFRYQYDFDDRMTNRWTPAKTNTIFKYDPVGNLTNVVYHNSPSITLQYDLLNRLTNMVDGVGSTVYAYNSAGLLLSEDGPWANDTVSYTYDNYRTRSGLSLQFPGGQSWAQSYTYDNAGRFSTISSPAGTFTYNYAASGKQGLLLGVQLPPGAFITNTFDSVGRMLSTTLKNSSLSALNAHQYSYTPASQRSGSTNTAGDYRSYTYDNFSELTGVSATDPGGANRYNEQRTYTYDPAGNLKTRSRPAGPFTETFALNSLNEITNYSSTGTIKVYGTTSAAATNVTVNNVAADQYADNTFSSSEFSVASGSNSFTAVAQDSRGRRDTNTITANLSTNSNFIYDLNGNLVSDGTRYFAYDDENQLTSVWKTNDWRSDFVYDGRSRRRLRREYTWAGSAWVLQSEVLYIYDGKLVFQERDSSNNALTTYTWGRDLSRTLQGAGGIGGLLARTDNSLLRLGDAGAHAYYQTDAGGNITCLLNTNQAIVGRYLYDPFGNTLCLSGPLASANLYRFSTKEFAAASDTYYYLHRFYAPSLQRWLTRDPLQEDGGLNLYGFVDNNAISEVDAYGLSATLTVNGKKFTVNNAQQVFNSITSTATGDGTITTLNYSGHGDTQGGLLMSDQSNGTLVNWEVEKWLKKNAKLFAKDAKIELNACGTANPNYVGNRVADAFKQALPEAQVWGFTGLDLWGIGVPNNWYFGNGHVNPKVPTKSVWVSVQLPK